LTVYLYCTVLAPAIIIWRHFGPPSSSEDGDILQRGSQGHVATLIRKRTQRGVEMALPKVDIPRLLRRGPVW
jgi:hypothetical protein